MNLFVSATIVAAFVELALCSRILGISPHFGVTHWMVFKPLFEELAARGHKVTVISPFPRDTPMENYVDFSIRDSYPANMGFVDLAALEESSRRSVWELVPLYEMSALTESTFQKEVLALANQTFDLILMEYFNTPIYLGLAHKIKAPIVALSSHQITGWATSSLSNPDDPSYVPHLLAFRSSPFSFTDRLKNLIELIISKMVYFQIFVPRAQATAEKHLGALPPLRDLEANASLILVNAHFSIHNPRPLNPNVIEVGGLNIRPPKPLPNVSNPANKT